MSRRGPLRRLGENIWVADRPQTFYGLAVGTRMTVIRLAGERLLLHSPVALDSDLRAELDPLLIRDRDAARRSLERILAWDFDRVVVAHGDVLESGGHEALRVGYAWLLSRND